MTDNTVENIEHNKINLLQFSWKRTLRPSYKIAFSGIMLALAIILSLLSMFLKFTSFLSFNLSLIPIFITFTYIGLNYALIVGFSRFLIMPLIASALPFSLGAGVEYLGNFIVFVSQLFFFAFFYLLYRVVNWSKISTPLVKVILVMILSALAVSIIMPILNTFLFNIIYFRILNVISSFSLSEIVKNYNSQFKGFFLGIPNYYAGSFTVYFIFNLTNILINCIIIYIFITWEYKTNFIYKISSKNTY
ncbi:MPN527 family putative ECF transporter permease subunit [Mycoplasma sp. MV126]|uniref:MPN527 family putative ECF transporter permease subunit n=1 Tax=Mycoplasma sp. MV126 TaxID=3401676 RepID=UPI003AAEBD80